MLKEGWTQMQFIHGVQGHIIAISERNVESYSLRKMCDEEAALTIAAEETTLIGRELTRKPISLK